MFLGTSGEFQNKISQKLDTYEKCIWVKRIIKIQRTMIVLEKQKHLKPFLTQAM